MEKHTSYMIAGLVVGIGVGYGIARGVDEYRYRHYEDEVDLDDAVDDIVNYVDDTIEKFSDDISEMSIDYTKYKKSDKVPEKPSIEEILKGYSGDEGIGMKVIGAADYEAKNDFEKLTATYFVKEKILAGYDDELEEQNGTDRGEYIVNYILDHPNDLEFYFRDLDSTSDIYVLVSEESFDDAYAEFLEREVAQHVEATKED